MTAYLIRRTVQAVVVLLLVTVIVFVLEQALPGETARAVLGPQANATTIATVNEEHGLNRPLPAQYLTWLGELLHGNLGYSYQQNQSVVDLLQERLPKTMVLAGTSLVLAVLVAIPLGILQALRRNRPSDYVLTGLA